MRNQDTSKVASCLKEYENSKKHEKFLACLKHIISEGLAHKFNIEPPSDIKFNNEDHTDIFFADWDNILKTSHYPVLSVLTDLLTYYDPDSEQMKVPQDLKETINFANEWKLSCKVV
jgi:hypothetical protein